MSGTWSNKFVQLKSRTHQLSAHPLKFGATPGRRRKRSTLHAVMRCYRLNTSAASTHYIIRSKNKSDTRVAAVYGITDVTGIEAHRQHSF